MVYLRIAGTSALATVVDSAGHYSFPDIPVGTYIVDSFDQLSNSAASQAVTITANATTTQDLALQSSGTVTGIVSTTDSTSVAGLTVTLTGTTGSGTQTLTTTTNAGGAFTFTGVKPGTLQLFTSTPNGLKASALGSLPLAGQSIVINLPLASTASVSGIVFQGDGTTPAAGVSVSIYPAPLTGTGTVTTDASGAYSFTDVRLGTDSVTASNASNSDRGYAIATLTTAGQNVTANITLNGVGNLTVKVKDAASNNIIGANVTVNNESVGITYHGTTDANGAATFTGMLAHEFQVSAQDPVTGLNGTASGTLTPGSSQTITVMLQAAGTLQGTVFAADGATPAANVTVSLSPLGTKPAVTGADGTYRFTSLVLGTYTVSATDSTGRLRARDTQVKLQNNGDVVTHNLTFVGVGSVSGIVRNVDGTVAQNMNLSLQSSNPSIGTTLTTTSGGDGTYTIDQVPTGSFTITVTGLPRNLLGYATGKVPSDGSHVTLDVQIVSSTVTLPITLNDADSFHYTIAPDGTFANATDPNTGYGVLNQANSLSITKDGIPSTFAQYGATTIAIQTLAGRQIEINQADLAGLNITRKIFVPSNGYFTRRLEVIQNPTSSPVTINVSLLGSERTQPSTPTIASTSNGTTTLDASTLWAVDDDDDGTHPYPQTQPAIAQVFQGTGATIRLDQLSATGYYTSNWQIVYKPITIPANGTASVLYFAAQESTPGTAATAAQRLVQLPPEALEGLSADELASIVNFVVPTQQTLSPVQAPAAVTLSGQVFAGDGVTPVPAALVYAQSADLYYGAGAQAAADASGTYSIPAFVAQSYAAEAYDASSQVQSPVVTGSVPSGASTQTQNINFTNTGIVQVTVKATGATIFTGGSATLYIPCATTTDICNYVSQNFGPSGNFSFLTALPGNDGLSASANIAGGNTIDVYGPGFTPALTAAVTAGQTTHVTITLPGVGSIGGTVKNADGTPALNTYVSATNPGNTLYRSASTDASGHYLLTALPVGPYTVSAQDPLTNTTVTKSVSVALDSTTTQDFTFTKKGTVVATVTYANGTIPTTGSAYLVTSDNATYYPTGGYDPSGKFTFKNVPVGAFHILAYYPNQSFYSTTNGTLTNDGETVQIAIKLPPVGTISGKVTFADGTPAAFANVSIADATNSFSTSARTDSAGLYTASTVPADRTVKVTASTYDPVSKQNVQVSATGQQISGDGATLTVNLAFAGYSTVVVTAKNGDGSLFSNGAAYLVSADGTFNGVTQLQSDGTATFVNVPDVKLTASVSSYSSSFRLGSKIVTLSSADAGKTVPITITASISGTITGHVYAADGTTALPSGYDVLLTDIDTGAIAYAYPDFDATYTFTGVRVGASGYTMKAESSSGTVHSAAVTGNITTDGQTVTQDFTLPLSAVSGTVYLYGGTQTASYETVYATQTINGTAQTLTGLSGPNGKYTIAGLVTGDASLSATTGANSSNTIKVTLAQDTDIITGKDLVMGPIGMVIGTIFDNAGNVAKNVNVSIETSASQGGFAEQISTDSTGAYYAFGIGLGNITVTVTFADNTTATGTGVLSTNGQTLTINIGKSSTARIFGTVFDANGNPTFYPYVHLKAAPPSTVVVNVQGDYSGVYTAYGIPVGNVTVTADNNGSTSYGSTTAPIKDTINAVEIDVGLAHPGAVTGTILDANRHPLPGVTVTVASSGDPGNTYTQTSLSNGNYFFGSITPGTITVTVKDTTGKVIGTATGTLPYGGNVTIYVNTTYTGALLQLPGFGPASVNTLDARLHFPSTGADTPPSTGFLSSIALASLDGPLSHAMNGVSR